MRSLARWVLATCASPVGIVVLAALDSTMVFSMPFGIDGAVVVLAARSNDLAWTAALLAALGSIAGGVLTFLTEIKLGEQGSSATFQRSA